MFFGNPWFYHSDRSLINSVHKENSNETSSRITSLAVSHHHDYIAVSSYDGLITIYFNNNQSVSTSLSSCNGESYYSQICWLGKSYNYLVAGRADGLIVYLDVVSSSMLDNKRSDEIILIDQNYEMHSQEISQLLWNEKQNDSIYLISVDKSGTCTLWKTVSNVPLAPMMRYDNGSLVNAIVFLDSMFPLNKQCNHFLFALDNGSIYHANESGDCQEIKVNDEYDPTRVIHSNNETATLILITQSMKLIQMEVKDGLFEIRRIVKLSISLSFEHDTLYFPHGHLICMTTEGKLLCFDLKSDENYELLQPTSNLHEDITNSTNESLSIASYEDYLVNYTRGGICTFWTFDNVSNQWIILESVPVQNIEDRKINCIFSSNSLILTSDYDVTLVDNRYSSIGNFNGIVALQTGPSTVAILNEADHGVFAFLDAGIDLIDIEMDNNHICIWNDTEVHVYKIDGCNQCELFSNIAIRVQDIAIHEDSLYLAKESSLLVTDMFGVQRLTISLPPEEGKILLLDTSCDQLAMMTCCGVIKTMDIRKKEPKLLATGRLDLNHLCGSHHRVISMKCNADGNILSILSESASTSQQLHFYDTNSENIVLLEHFDGRDSKIMSQYWDPSFSRLFACEVRSKSEAKTHVLTLFVSESLNISVHEETSHKLSSRLVGVNAPNKLFVNSSSSLSHPDEIYTQCLIGLEDAHSMNPESLSALVDFAYYLIVGDMDKAHICVLSIRSNIIWHKLAQACVFHDRLDIAEKCLMKLGNGNGVDAVRRANKEVALAEVAIQLGMLDEAEKLYRNWNRLDLLSDLFRRQGRWKEAFDIVPDGCLQRHILNKQYKMKLDLTKEKDDYYTQNTKSLTFKKQQLLQLILDKKPVESFLRQDNDMKLLNWYAEYMESIGEIDRAKDLYNMTDNTLGLVRLACAEGDLTTAFTLVRTSKSCVGAYHLARYLEANGDIEGAISCFARSGKFNYAIRLSKKFGINKEIMNFAMQCESSKTIECANYLESKGQNENAAELFMKAGEKKRALALVMQLPFENNGKLQADILSIIKGLQDDVPDDLVAKCVIFLIQSGNACGAFEILQAKGKDLNAIFDLYLQYNIPLTESVVNDVSIRFKDHMTKSLSLKIASILKAQGNYVSACKKFTQGGDRSNAIKCLLLSGDISSIISYAITSRTKEVYIIAANYLQTIDYYQNDEIKKTLLQLYSKAKSNNHLYRLMCSWSTFEASDGEYEVALKWLLEAEKYGEMCIEWERSEDEIWTERNIKAVKNFITAQNVAMSEPSETRKLCREILKENKKGDLLQLGDCYALLVQIENDCNKALVIVEEMDSIGLNPENYIEECAIKSIYEASGKKWKAYDIHQESKSDEQTTS